MDTDEVKAKINLLMTNILLGPVDKSRVQEVAQLASSHALFPYFRQQLNRIEAEIALRK